MHKDEGSIPGRAYDGKFSPCHHVQTGSGTQPSSYLMGEGGSFPRGKVAEA
jgi:hypothetical protein